MEPIKIGPLTGDEWASLALGDDLRNPLPPCCPNLSEARDALFAVMRAGGDPDLYWRSVAEVWPDVESHLGADDVAADPILSKLHAAYVAGRPAVKRDGESLARILARDPAHVKVFLEVLTGPDAPWDLETRQGQIEAAAHVGGKFVGYVLDPNERFTFAGELAVILGWDDAELCVLIDVLRARENLPYEPTHPDHRGS
jgi:hypothetical protein